MTMLASTLLAAVVLAAEPPQVVEIAPAHGDAFVDPTLTEIVVTFDRDMHTGGFSWVGGGENFPQITSRPRWTTPRRCVLPVRLRPGWNYRIRLNSPSHRNFRSAEGVPLAPRPLWFRTAAEDDDGTGRLSENDNAVAIAQVRVALRTRYSYRDRLGVDWDALIDSRAAMLEASPAPLTFAARLAPILAAAEDLHLTVRADGVGFPTFSRTVSANRNMDWLLPRLRKTERHAREILSAYFEDGTGYLAIESWRPDQRGLVDAAYRRVADAPALIIDVRGNSGGDEPSARLLAGRFIDEPVVYAKHVTVAPNTPGGFTAVRERVLHPGRDDGPRYAGPVAVLMGPVCMSSNEAFLLMMKASPRSTLVGARSRGSSGNPKPVALPNRVTLVLPSWKAMRPDGTVFEGEGIEPDVEVTGPFDKDDPVVIRALELLADDRGRN